jgi:adenine-specific DNA-methyltransferase
MDEVFGSENFVATIIWKNATDNNPTRVAVEHEYIMCYARSATAAAPVWKSSDSAARDLLVNVGSELSKQFSGPGELQEAYTAWFRENRSVLGPLDRYKYIDADGVYTGSQSVHNPGREGYRYDVIHPVTGKACKQPMLGYRFPKETMDQLLRDGRVLFGDDENKIIELKVYAKDYKQKFPSVIDLDGRLGANELRRLFPDSTKVFTNPKPVSLLRDVMSFVVEDNDIVLDFFAGSGTTTHAVLEQNAADGGRRRSIAVQLPEPATSGPFDDLSEVTRRRIAAAMDKLGASGLRAYRLEASGFRAETREAPAELFDLEERTLGHDRPADAAVAAEVLLKEGVPLDATWVRSEAGGAPVITADGVAVVLSLGINDDVVREALDAKPRVLVLLEDGLAGADAVKANAVTNAKNLGITLKTV